MEELPPLFRLAKSASKHSNYRVRVGAVLTDKKRRPISIGFNQCKTHPKYADEYGKTIHAEMSALIVSDREYLEGAEIFVYRETKDGRIAMARPCERCLKNLKIFGVKRIWYTTSNYPYFDTEKV